MARRWRIRHKLTLGLALVVGIMALLLVGTLKGLFSYRSTMKTIDSKLSELKAAQQLEDSVGELSTTIEGATNPSHNAQEIQGRISATQEALEEYRQRLCDTLVHRRDFDEGYDEKPLIITIQGQLQKLSKLVREQETKPAVMTPHPGPDLIQADARLLQQVQVIRQTVSTLEDHIHTDLNRRINRSKEDYRTSLGLVCCTSVLGAVLMLGLARLAYRWIVDPIRDLHEKVGRLAEGNFDSRIEVHSGDEMQDLAGAFNDMTDRLQAIYHDLARQVNERSRQLVRSERLAGVGFLAAGVAHEINNPLASIAFCSEALESRLKDLLAGQNDGPELETIQNYLKMIQQEAFRCKGITQQLLEFSRVGERPRQMTVLSELIQSVIDMVLHLQSYKGKQIVFEARQRPRLSANVQDIKSVVLNLIVNALDSMEEGGELVITLDIHEGVAEIAFQDTGCGMAPDVLENLFEPFFTRSRTGKGIGLGLSISHRIVTQHGGEIEATSAGPKQGSTFVVRLPLSAAQTSSPAPLQLAA